MSNPFPVLTPDFKEFMDLYLRNFKTSFNCMSIGTINAFDSTTQTATIQINFLRVLRGAVPANPQPTDKQLPYPLLVNCPVMVLSGGTARLTFPIAVGDTCLVLFCDRDIDTWYTSGQIQAPATDRTHDLNDGIAIVGIRSMLNKITDYSETSLQLQYQGSIFQIDSEGHGSFIDNTGERLSQSGDLKATARSSAPSGWLLCYGQSLVAADYPDLFDAIGYTYGGSGANFNVPDLRGRSPIGLDNMGGSSANVLTNAYTPNRNTLGGAIGQETQTLDVTQIPPHHHRVKSTGGGGVGYAAAGFDTFGDVTEDTGGGQPHYNVQPGRMFNWVIKI